MGNFDKEAMKRLVRERKLKTTEDAENLVKELFGDIIKEMLETELEEELGYSKHDYRNKETDNSRNGYSKKTVNTSYGKIELSIPRDRKGEFEPIVVKKHQRSIASIEDQILSMYARGMTYRDIQAHLKDIYGSELSTESISRITDKIIPIVSEWRNRPLEEVYTIIYMDAIFFKVSENNQIRNKALYIAFGINLEGMKDVLGMWIAQSEGSKYWLGVLNELKNRGVKGVMFFSIDGLKGMEEAIEAVYPQAKIQRCVVHQIRYSMKFVSWKDKKKFAADLKSVYTADTREAAWNALMAFEEKWGEKYPFSIKSWKDNWESLTTYFEYPKEIRKLIYTTNPIESLNSQLRKVTKNRGVFPNDMALMKLAYLAINNITRKWTVRINEWDKILATLMIEFDWVKSYV
ncbi:IS256 family transposase [Kosmotoga olearia]|uniref:Mutator family transposase n=3 Tax=Kosmotoga TaxID=651456 RepID=C5CDQ6_KOSOT|nr:IS256 family transposase [Kosmotoga olearia]ACR79750.1 transposase mutator type [Kosmotoga olearia TBF 19.5.1]ACR79843.1 transposase mutator type [Kosmotoga olearia TBF 19.5.1]ACR80068.1 transposase mutator type [Kosmotoga olearia TBF 19.5.1]